MSIRIEEIKNGDITVLRLTGRLTLGEGTATFRDRITTLLAQGKKKLVLNMEEVWHTDASGLGEMVSAFTQVTNSGGHFVLCNPSKRMIDDLQMTKLYTVFDIHSNESHALRSLS